MAARTLLSAVISWAISLFYGWLVILLMAYKIVKYGRKFFEVKRPAELPKAAFDPKFGRHGFANLKTQRIRLHYVESGNRDNPMMLMIHGFPDFWYSWRHQIPKFSENYWVVAVDMRGYGDSDQPRNVKDYKMQNLVEDLKELIITLGKDSATLVAHDWGGVIAFQLAEKEPELVKSLIVLNAPYLRTMRKVLKTSWKQFFMSWYMYFFQLPYLPEFFLTSNNLDALRRVYQKRGKEYCTDEEYEMYHFNYSQRGAFTPPLNYYRANFGLLEFIPEEDTANSNIRCPTLIIWGDQDSALSIEVANTAQEACENASLSIVSAGHWVHHERPDLVNKYIQDFTKV